MLISYSVLPQRGAASVMNEPLHSQSVADPGVGTEGVEGGGGGGSGLTNLSQRF